MTPTTKTQWSINPAGEKFPLPEEKDYQIEFERLTELTQQAHQKGQEVVVVMGAGFVGAVMAAVVAGSKDKQGKYSKFELSASVPVRAVTGRSP